MTFPLSLLFLLLLSALLGHTALAVDRSKFRTCALTNFCAHHRARTDLSKEQSLPGLTSSFELGGGVLRSGNNVVISCLSTGVIRVRATDPIRTRYEAKEVLADVALAPFVAVSGETNTYECNHLTRLKITMEPSLRLDVYDVLVAGDATPYATLSDFVFEHATSSPTSPERSVANAVSDAEEKKNKNDDDGREILDWGEDGKPIYKDEVDGHRAPDEPQQQQQQQPPPPQQEIVSRSSPETFGGVTDPKPKGPNAISLDVTFPRPRTKLYGLPEHATSFSLKDTSRASGSGGYDEPYRLYNLDVFEYEINNPMALYGTVPFVLARWGGRGGGSSGFFLNNPSETFVDISSIQGGGGGRKLRWISETGNLDAFIFPAISRSSSVSQKEEDAAIYAAYSRLTGASLLPPLFSLGYHQSRWNYRDQKDVDEVHEKFEQHDFPLDVIWLDIEHTNGKRYFTWDAAKFPDPVKMVSELKAKGRKLVTIVDPHVKRAADYVVHTQAESGRRYVMEEDKVYDGWCWPGSSSYPDFTSLAVRDWWASLYTSLYSSMMATDAVHIWNDMNEPSVFNGPEVTMKKTLLSLEGVEHREWHNVYGLYYHMATYQGMTRARPTLRPFILTRSFFAGTQRLGAVWTGDNRGDWDHLRASIPMILSFGVAGIPFVGADIPGFFGDADVELLTRWYEVGIYYPFFRAHAHIDTKRREPWLFGEEVLQRLRAVVGERYRLLPYLYTIFFENAREGGSPVMRPAYGIGEESSFLLGGDLLVAPVLTKGATSVEVRFPNEAQADIEAVWYDSVRGERYDPKSTPFLPSFSAPLGRAPVFQRGGSIIPKQMRLRRSSELMRDDPYTLVVAVSRDGLSASGRLYVDDFQSFTSEEVLIQFTLTNGNTLRGVSGVPAGSALKRKALQNRLERVLVFTSKPCRPGAGAALQGGEQWKFEIECAEDATMGSPAVSDTKGKTMWVTVLRKPWVMIGEDFEIRF